MFSSTKVPISFYCNPHHWQGNANLIRRAGGDKQKATYKGTKKLIHFTHGLCWQYSLIRKGVITIYTIIYTIFYWFFSYQKNCQFISQKWERITWTRVKHKEQKLILLSLVHSGKVSISSSWTVPFCGSVRSPTNKFQATVNLTWQLKNPSVSFHPFSPASLDLLLPSKRTNLLPSFFTLRRREAYIFLFFFIFICFLFIEIFDFLYENFIFYRNLYFSFISTNMSFFFSDLYYILV